jgi:NAD-dependent dihydropyrimidine dehydrogenase PreA subunit
MTENVWQGDAVTIKIDDQKCKSHANCVDTCPGEVYQLQAGKPVPVNINQCLECCTCVEVCPEKAIQHSACDPH